MKLPRVYAIADAGTLAGRGISLREYAAALAAAGVGVVQYRDKSAGPREILAAVAALREAMPDVILVLNDRADLALLGGCDGVHVGQGDLGVADARYIFDRAQESMPQGLKPLPLDAESPTLKGGGTLRQRGMVGVSTHTAEQVRAADASAADYVAVGPVFATGSKVDAEPVVGLEFVRAARRMTAKPLVAIGGITAENAASVFGAGADCVAVISAMLPRGGESLEESVGRFVAACSE